MWGEGLLITSKIHEMAQAVSGSLGYSSLITQLRKKVGCHIEGDMLLKLERAITAAKINKDVNKFQGQQGDWRNHPLLYNLILVGQGVLFPLHRG